MKLLGVGCGVLGVGMGCGVWGVGCGVWAGYGVWEGQRYGANSMQLANETYRCQILVTSPLLH